MNKINETEMDEMSEMDMIAYFTHPSMNSNLLSKMGVLIDVQSIKIRHLIKKLIGWKDEKRLVEFF